MVNTSGIREIRQVMEQAERNRALGERTIVFVDVGDRFFQIGIHLFITVETAGEFRGVGIRIDTDGKHVIVVVVNGTETVFPVERMKLLTIEEKHFFIGIFRRIKFAVVSTCIFNCQ